MPVPTHSPLRALSSSFHKHLMHLCPATRGTHTHTVSHPHRANHSRSSSSAAALHTHLLRVLPSPHTGETNPVPATLTPRIYYECTHTHTAQHHSSARSQTHKQATAAPCTQNAIPCICCVHRGLQIILATPIAYMPQIMPHPIFTIYTHRHKPIPDSGRQT